MNLVFSVIYRALMITSRLTGLSYNEMNIVVYYLIIPALLLALTDVIIKKPIFTPALFILWAFALLWVRDFSAFSDRIFDASVIFLNSFGFVSWNYIVASVIICVVLPALLFAFLFYRAFPGLFRRR